MIIITNKYISLSRKEGKSLRCFFASGRTIAAALALILLWPGAGASAQTELAPGKYTADYLILKAEDDSVSMANDYWEKPATVELDGKGATIRLTVNHSEWVTVFQVPAGNGKYVDTKIIETNEAENKRLVEFTAADITEPIISKIHVTVPEIDYDHDYTIRLSFQTDSFKLIEPVEKDAAPPSAPAAAETTDPGDVTAVSAEPEAVPVPAPAESAPAPVSAGKPQAENPAPEKQEDPVAPAAAPAAGSESAPSADVSSEGASSVEADLEPPEPATETDTSAAAGTNATDPDPAPVAAPEAEVEGRGTSSALQWTLWTAAVVLAAGSGAAYVFKLRKKPSA